MIGTEQTKKDLQTDSTTSTTKDNIKALESKPKDTIKRLIPVPKKTVPAKTKDGLVNDVPEF